MPEGRLTYFGYLSIIKPHFDSWAARDLLSRDSRSTGDTINTIVKKILEELLCTIYIATAEHERLKELIVLGDQEEGGYDPGALYNIYELMDIIRKGASQSNKQNNQT